MVIFILLWICLAIKYIDGVFFFFRQKWSIIEYLCRHLGKKTNVTKINIWKYSSICSYIIWNISLYVRILLGIIDRRISIFFRHGIRCINIFCISKNIIFEFNPRLLRIKYIYAFGNFVNLLSIFKASFVKDRIGIILHPPLFFLPSYIWNNS